MTKTQAYDGYTGGRQCSAIADFPGRKSACRNAARYPDGDGVRWWCDEHNPRAKKPASQKPPDKAFEAQGEISDIAKGLVLVVESAMKALSDIENCRPVGWEPTDPVEKYRVLLEQACDLATAAGERIKKDLKQLVD